MAHLLGREFDGVTIAPSEHFWGLAIMMPLRPSEEDLANIDSPVPHVPPRLRRIIEENIMILLAGAIAEELVEPRSGRYEDPTPRPRIVAEDVAKDEKLSARARQRLGPPGRLLRRVREEEDIEEENLRFVRSLRGDDDLQDAVERADAEETDEFLASAARAELDRLDALWAES